MQTRSPTSSDVSPCVPRAHAASDRDVFGGHGLFDDLRPIGIASALCGLLPVRLGPMRFSFHPLKSSLLYAVLVTLVVYWSTWRLVTDRMHVFTQRRMSLVTRFTSVVSFGSVSGIALLPLLWLETQYLRQDQHPCRHLMIELGASFRASGSSAARTVVQGALLCLGVFLPSSVVLWLAVLASEGASWTHWFAHMHVLAMPLLQCANVAGSAFCVKRLADVLQASLVQELRAPWVDPRRIRAHRIAWLHLRDVVQNLVRAPLTVLAMVLHMILMSTLASYQALVCVMAGQMPLGMLLLLLGSHYYLLLLLLCDAVHRVSDAVGREFRHPLETFGGVSVSQRAQSEIRLFRKTVSSSRLEVSAAGYWHASRHAITSVMSATVAYVIVLVQFRHPERQPVIQITNATHLLLIR
ncbi:uncharacterized protein LOC117652825 [Thrips palmi]|uniref:Gustatory receptor n=1 Tax=Thrips palmi TaxID=161013 RepID=A0A6P9A7D4_THRPL|nr:uncharacterized protein LOC117652825 [Thrips palmi]XP_034253869.1 uncharacterized protein LOC117652825 [Thrips palmi]XP_034253870.1 uncharacterized protein LOC117652825 [Thrips palmi]